MKKWILRIFTFLLIVFITGYATASIWLYRNQESLIFMNPVKLDADYTYEFDEAFQEINLESEDQITLSSLLFKATEEPPKGVVFVFKGAAGNISKQNEAAKIYTDLGYDFYIMDVRGFGKSQGVYSNEQQMYYDAELGYNKLLTLGYSEENIILIGVSLGSGLASYLAANHDPRQLILISPYYNLKDLAQNLTYSNKVKALRYLPTDLLLKYNLDNATHLKNTTAPVTIFHGTNDRLIYYGSSLKLQEHFKPQDQLITIEGGIHNGFTERPDVIEGIKDVITKFE